MHVPDVELHESTTLAEASDLLRRYAPDARVLAGGTDLLVDLKTGRLSVGHLVTIHRIDELRGVRREGEDLWIGALTTITQLGRSAELDGPYAPIRDATSRMAAPQVRNVATVGGNLVSAVPCADLPPILTVMDASVLLWSPAGQRRVALRAFFRGVRTTERRDDEVLTAVVVPAPPDGFGAAYARFSMRDGNAIAVASVAASLRFDKSGKIVGAKLALGAVCPTPKTVEGVDLLLKGRVVDDETLDKAATAAMAAAEPITDVRGSASYRREVVGVMTRRALTTAAARAQEFMA